MFPFAEIERGDEKVLDSIKMRHNAMFVFFSISLYLMGNTSMRMISGRNVELRYNSTTCYLPQTTRDIHVAMQNAVISHVELYVFVCIIAVVRFNIQYLRAVKYIARSFGFTSSFLVLGAVLDYAIGWDDFVLSSIIGGTIIGLVVGAILLVDATIWRRRVRIFDLSMIVVQVDGSSQQIPPHDERPEIRTPAARIQNEEGIAAVAPAASLPVPGN